MTCHPARSNTGFQNRYYQPPPPAPWIMTATFGLAAVIDSVQMAASMASIFLRAMCGRVASRGWGLGRRFQLGYRNPWCLRLTKTVAELPHSKGNSPFRYSKDMVFSIGLAAMVLAADVAVRLVAPDQDLKLGVLTALVGAPFFLHLIWQMRRVEA